MFYDGGSDWGNSALQNLCKNCPCPICHDVDDGRGDLDDRSLDAIVYELVGILDEEQRHRSEGRDGKGPVKELVELWEE